MMIMNLPIEIQRLIYEFDNTYYYIYKNCMNNINLICCELKLYLNNECTFYNYSKMNYNLMPIIKKRAKQLYPP